MSTFAIFVIFLGFFFFSGVIVMVPRTLLRPQLKERLWQLRDEAYDARRQGLFPYEDPAIGSLIWRIEGAIRIADELTLARVFVVLWLARKMPPEEKEMALSISRPNLEKLTVPQIEKYQELDRRFTSTVSTMPLLGTWLGLSVLIVLIPIVMVAWIISAFSSTVERKTENVLVEQRIRVEGIAFELSQERRMRKPRGRMAGV